MIFFVIKSSIMGLVVINELMWPDNNGSGTDGNFLGSMVELIYTVQDGRAVEHQGCDGIPVNEVEGSK